MRSLSPRPARTNVVEATDTAVDPRRAAILRPREPEAAAALAVVPGRDEPGSEGGERHLGLGGAERVVAARVVDAAVGIERRDRDGRAAERGKRGLGAGSLGG